VTAQRKRRIKLLTLAAVLWVGYLIPWSGPWWLEAAKPSFLAAVFAIMSWCLGVGSWPLTIVFSLTFFVYSAVDMYVGSDLASEGPNTRVRLIYLGAVVFSPITLWGPVLLGAVAYAAAQRLRPNSRWSGP
jgi:hypothetical protein